MNFSEVAWTLYIYLRLFEITEEITLFDVSCGWALQRAIFEKFSIAGNTLSTIVQIVTLFQAACFI